MLSPGHGKRASSTSAGRYSAAALRRGEVKISDPVLQPKDMVDSPMLPKQGMAINLPRLETPADGTWPRRGATPESAVWPGSEGGPRDASHLALNRASSGQSVLLSTMSSTNSSKQRKSGGFRATIRSFFGSKRRRSSLSNDRSYHISVRG